MADKQKEFQQAMAAVADKLKAEAPSPATGAPQKCKPPSKPPTPLSPKLAWAGDRDPFAPVRLVSNLEKWESFNWDRHPKLLPAKRVIVDWYNGLPNSGALVLAGDVGCGKTHLAEAIYDLYGHWYTSFYSEIALIKAIQATYGKKAMTSEAKIWGGMKRSRLIIADDIGEYQTDNTAFLSNFYSSLFNELMTIEDKPLLITTNLRMTGANGLESRIGTRSSSRLHDALGNLKDGRYIDLFGISDKRVEGYLG